MTNPAEYRRIQPSRMPVDQPADSVVFYGVDPDDIFRQMRWGGKRRREAEE